MLGLVLFSVASFAGGVAQSEGWLLAARAAQGLGAAIVSPAALSILTTTFAEGAERNRALGIWGATVGAGGAAGVLLGGILTSGLNWRWVLFVNVPIGIAAAALAPRTLVESRADDGASTFDFPGAITVTAGLSLLVYAIVDAVNVGWGSTATLSKIAVAVLLLVAFLIIETRQRHPLMPFTIFRLRTLRGANLVGLLLGMSLFSMFFFISLYLQNVLHYSPIKTGISYLPLAVGIILSAGAASQLVTRIGFKPMLVTGLLLIAGGLAWFSRVPGVGGSYAADVLGPSLLAAVGVRVRVRVGDDRGGHRDQAARGGAGIGSDQHLAADRRSARTGDPRDDRQQPHPEPLPLRSPQRLRRPHQGVRSGVSGRRGLRSRRRDPGLRTDLLARQPRAVGRRPQRRPGSRSGGRLRHPPGSASARLQGFARIRRVDRAAASAARSRRRQ